MSILATAINGAWMISCRRERAAFAFASTDVEASQRAVLAEILTNDASTAFGRDHGLRPGHSYEQFARRVPITGYDGHASYVDRIAAGEPGVLTADRVRVLQPTSGSTGGRKLIPHTRAVQRLLQRTISAWIGDLFAARPAVRRGRAYWSISPAFTPERPTPGGVRVGFADDTEYLSGPERLAVRRVLAVPPEVVDACSVTAFRHQTLAHLITTRDLTLVSVWSPTFLTALIDELYRAPETTDSVLRRAARLDGSRAERAARILGSAAERSEQLAELWPSLALISCWGDGSAAAYLPEVERLFPGVELQPKGLLATEAFVSFPLVGRSGGALAIRSHLFEFLPVGPASRADGGDGGADDGDGGAESVLAHELEVGRRYKPVVTTGGGLWRYLLDDVVEVIDHEGGCPLLRFVGRGSTSDLVGEKLDEGFVGEVLAKTLDGDSMLVADRSGVDRGGAGAATLPAYRLLVDGDLDDPSLAARVDELLAANPHYALARQLGQLGPVDVIHVGGGVRAWYERAMLNRGSRLGDVKPVRLLPESAGLQAQIGSCDPVRG